MSKKTRFGRNSSPPKNKAKLRRKIDQQQREIRELKRIRKAQALMLRALREGDQIIVADTFLHADPDGTVRQVRTPPGTLTPMMTVDGAIKLRRDGIEHAVQLIQRMESATRYVERHVVMIATAANCENGPHTRAIAGLALDKLVSALNKLDIVCREVQATASLVTFNWEVLTQAYQAWSTLRTSAANFLAQQTDRAQAELRLVVATIDETFKTVYNEFTQAKAKPRGKPPGPQPLQAYILESVITIWNERNFSLEQSIRHYHQSLIEKHNTRTITARETEALDKLGNVNDPIAYVTGLYKHHKSKIGGGQI